MEGLDIPNIGTAGAIAAVVILFMLIGFMKGMVRMLFGLIALGAGSVAAYWGFLRGDAIAGYVISKPDPWMSGAVGLILGLATLFATRAIFGMLLKPPTAMDGKKKLHAGPGGLLGLLTGLTLVWFTISAVRYIGTLTELQWVQNCLAEEGKITKLDKPALVSLRDLIDGTTPGKFHREYDFLNSPIRAEIAKLRILTEHSYAITQAKVDPGVRGAFRQADIRKFLENSQDLTAFITEAKFSHLIEAPSLRELSAIPEAREVMAAANVTQALDIQPVVEEKPKEKKPVDPNAPASGSARIF